MKTAAQEGQQKPPAPEAAHQVICNAGCRRLLTKLRKCKCLGANEAGGEPSPLGETRTHQTNNTNLGGPEPLTQINIDNGDASGIAHRRPTYKRFRWLLTKLRLIRNRDRPQPSAQEEIQNHHKPLIVHGFMILDELASDPGNCTAICKTMDLMPKILAPITHGLLNTLGNDPKTIQIVKASLRVVAKLTSGTCESSSKLLNELISGNGRTARNIMWIMRNSSDEQEMRMLAVEIVTRLTLGQSNMCGFFDSQDSPPAGEAQNALAVYLRSWVVICQEVGDLVALMNADGTSTKHRAVTAEFLAQICVKSKTDQDRMDRLSSVSNSLSKVLEAIVTTEIADMTTERRKFLASFLCLAVQIRENLATAQAFANAVRGLPIGEKLEEIIVEMTSENDSEDVIFLVITKAAAKLVTWTMSSNPVYAHYFQWENIVDKLKDIVNATGDLERRLVLRGDADADEMEPPYETLQALVEELESCLVALLGTAGQAA